LLNQVDLELAPTRAEIAFFNDTPRAEASIVGKDVDTAKRD
jgi:hypothetical protein